MRKFLVILFLMCTMLSFAKEKRALVVGISEYPQYKHSTDASWSPIHGTNDALLISKSLKAQKFSVQTLLNKNATASNIRKALRKLTSEASKGDYIYLHFSCHGQPFEDLNGDEEDGWDESLVPYDAQMTYKKDVYEGANHITDDELHTYLQKLREAVGTNGLVCVVIDACHAGGASRGENESDEDDQEEFVRGTKSGFSAKGTTFRPRINAKGNFYIPQAKGAANIVILEACRSYQSNYEIKQSGQFYGPLSYYLNQVLQTLPITASNSWVLKVKELMNADRRLSRQNMVYETSLK